MRLRLPGLAITILALTLASAGANDFGRQENELRERFEATRQATAFFPKRFHAASLGTRAPVALSPSRNLASTCVLKIPRSASCQVNAAMLGIVIGAGVGFIVGLVVPLVAFAGAWKLMAILGALVVGPLLGAWLGFGAGYGIGSGACP